jgi:hypothetical protein
VTKRISLILLLEITLGLITSGAVIPALAEPEWTVTIDGNVFNPTTLSITQLMAMPSKTVYAELYCYGAYVTAGNWTGVKLNVLLEYVEADPNAMSLGFSATDGYNREISITEATQDNVILAYEINGVPLSETLRLVLPGSNGEFWVAMINHVTVSTNSASYPLSGTGVNLPTLNPTPQPSPTITPTPTPTPVDSPLPTPTTTPKPTITATPPPQASPILLYEAGAGTIVILLIIGIAYFMKKR